MAQGGPFSAVATLLLIGGWFSAPVIYDSVTSGALKLPKLPGLDGATSTADQTSEEVQSTELVPKEVDKAALVDEQAEKERQRAEKIEAYYKREALKAAKEKAEKERAARALKEAEKNKATTKAETLWSNFGDDAKKIEEVVINIDESLKGPQTRTGLVDFLKQNYDVQMEDTELALYANTQFDSLGVPRNVGVALTHVLFYHLMLFLLLAVLCSCCCKSAKGEKCCDNHGACGSSDAVAAPVDSTASAATPTPDASGRTTEQQGQEE